MSLELLVHFPEKCPVTSQYTREALDLVILLNIEQDGDEFVGVADAIGMRIHAIMKDPRAETVAKVKFGDSPEADATLATYFIDRSKAGLFAATALDAMVEYLTNKTIGMYGSLVGISFSCRPSLGGKLTQNLPRQYLPN